MIRYALKCSVCDAEFEAWFASSEAFDKQAECGQLECAVCGEHDVQKQIMSPAIGTSRDATPSSPEAAFKAFAQKAKKFIRETHDYVGNDFADTARSMHEGEIEHRPIWGETTSEQAKSLAEDGVPATPLPKPFAPKPPRSTKQLN